nr:hypothetical protein [uncultured Flavobacterium sp.]
MKSPQPEPLIFLAGKERPEEAPFMVRKISGSGEDLKRSAGNCFGKLYSKKLKIM